MILQGCLADDRNQTAIRKRPVPLASSSRGQGLVSAQLTLALADFFFFFLFFFFFSFFFSSLISVKMADKNSGPEFSDQEVNSLISQVIINQKPM